MNPPSRGSNLDSWKEIAAYLRRDIRTVQRWEKQEGLPVHRPAHLDPPAGVAQLSVGEEVSISVEGIGTLTNRVVARD